MCSIHLKTIQLIGILAAGVSISWSADHELATSQLQYDKAPENTNVPSHVMQTATYFSDSSDSSTLKGNSVLYNDNNQIQWRPGSNSTIHKNLRDKRSLRNNSYISDSKMSQYYQKPNSTSIKSSQYFYIPKFFGVVHLVNDKNKAFEDVGLFLPGRPVNPKPASVKPNDLTYEHDCMTYDRIRPRPYPNSCYNLNKTKTPIILRSREHGRKNKLWESKHNKHGLLVYSYLDETNNERDDTKTINEDVKVPLTQKQSEKRDTATKVLETEDRQIEFIKISQRQREADKENLWEVFWKEIRNDFAFTFDFVLWDNDYTQKKETQFWFLMLYLKTLAIYIDHPKKFLLENDLESAITIRANALKRLALKKKDNVSREKVLQKRLSNLISAITRLEYDKTTLLQQLDVLNVNMVLYEGEKSILESRIDDVHAQADMITHMANKFMPVVVHTNSVPSWKPMQAPNQEISNVKFLNGTITVNNG